MLLHISAAFPVSMRSEKRFLRLVERFQASADFLSRSAPAHSLPGQWQHAFHRHEVLTIPAKLAGWQPFLPPDLVAPSRDELDTLLATITRCQESLLAKDSADPENAAAELASSCAMIDWSPWRLPRF